MSAPHADRDRTAPPTDRDADNVPSAHVTAHVPCVYCQHETNNLNGICAPCALYLATPGKAAFSEQAALRAENDSLKAQLSLLTRDAEYAEDRAEKAEAVRAEVERLTDLIVDLTDPDPCWFDHNGGCQAHGYLTLARGETCPQADAQEVRRAALRGPVPTEDGAS